ncbi:hypothetical protein FACS1894187_01410 [Synergistales bacterium]|nr:hypothetical protein FACS1894187_01410 [Synergistales bacterium]
MFWIIAVIVVVVILFCLPKSNTLNLSQDELRFLEEMEKIIHNPLEFFGHADFEENCEIAAKCHDWIEQNGFLNDEEKVAFLVKLAKRSIEVHRLDWGRMPLERLMLASRLSGLLRLLATIRHLADRDGTLAYPCFAFIMSSYDVDFSRILNMR